MLANSSALYVRFKSIEIINVRIHKHKTLQQEFSQYLYRSFGHIPLQDTEAFFGRRNIHSRLCIPRQASCSWCSSVFFLYVPQRLKAQNVHVFLYYIPVIHNMNVIVPIAANIRDFDFKAEPAWSRSIIESYNSSPSQLGV